MTYCPKVLHSCGKSTTSFSHACQSQNFFLPERYEFCSREAELTIKRSIYYVRNACHNPRRFACCNSNCTSALSWETRVSSLFPVESTECRHLTIHTILCMQKIYYADLGPTSLAKNTLFGLDRIP